MSTPRVSVLMPVLNPDPVYFRRAVESVLAQTLADLELIIVEDPGERHAAAVLDAVDDPRIRHVRNERRTSLVRQRNRTLELARGEFVAMLDGDDIARPDRLAKQVAFLGANPGVAVVGSWIEAIDTRDGTIGFRKYPTDHDAIYRAMRLYNPIAQPAVMCRKAAVVAAGGYTYEKYPAVEDYELWCRMAKAGMRFANLPEPLLRYRIHPGGMKATKLRGILRGTVDVKREYWKEEMGMTDCLRILLEQSLVVVPSQITTSTFIHTSYTKTI